MWLEGVEEMQEEAWIPDTKQWKRIREKIDQIDSNTGPVFPGPVSHQANPAASHIGPQSLGNPFELPQMVPTGGMTGMNPIQSPGPGGMGIASSKTPDIDTSSGTYKTPFN